MRIAHLSDLHLRHHLPGTAALATRACRAMPAVFERALAQVAAWAPDLLVLTGDLIDYPLDALDDPAMRAAGAADLRLLADLLATLPCAQMVVPGNHDPADLAREAFGHLGTELACGDYRVLGFWDREGPGHVPERPDDERRRFAAALADDDPRPQLHVQHYLFWPAVDAGYPYNYADAAELADAAATSGRVRLVLSGHYHDGFSPARHEGVWYATAPSLAETPHRLRLYELSRDDLTCWEHTVEE